MGFIALSSAKDRELIETISELVVEDIVQAPENDLVFLFAGVIDGRNGCSIDGNRGFNSISARFFNRRCAFFLVRFKRSEEHTSELQSLMRISYAVFCLKKKK